MASISENISGKRKVGRPRKDEIYGGHIRGAEDKIADRLPELIDNLFNLAGGIWYEEMLPDGQTRTVYKRPPDRAANEYLINRIMGKPTDLPAPPGGEDEPDQPPATDADGNTTEP